MFADGMREDAGRGEIVKAIGSLMMGIGAIAAISVFLLIPQYKKVHEFKQELATLEVKARQYGDFRESEEKITTQRERIKGVLRNANIERLLKDKTDQGVFEALGRICEETNVMMDKIDHDQSNSNGQRESWNICFRAPYDKLVALISLLEKSFVIDKFHIVGGEDGPVHTVNMLIRPIDVPSADSASVLPGKDLFDMYNEIEVVLKRLEYDPGVMARNWAVIKDPLTFDR